MHKGAAPLERTPWDMAKTFGGNVMSDNSGKRIATSPRWSLESRCLKQQYTRQKRGKGRENEEELSLEQSGGFHDDV